MTQLHTIVTATATACALLTTACMRGGGSTTDPDSAASTVDNSESVESEGNVIMAAVDGADMGLAPVTGDQAAAHIAANTNARFQPAGCAVATASGSNVTIDFSDCTGPRGLVHVTGELDLAVTVAPSGSIDVHATASGLAVNLATMDFTSDATYAVIGGQDALTVTTDGSGTGPLGNDIAHQGTYTITWDPGSQCGSISGHWSTEITGATASAMRSNDVDLSRCLGGCPSGMITHHFLGGASLTATFDGTNIGQWTTSTGRSGTIQLACQ